MTPSSRNDPGQWFEAQPLWFKTAVFYEIHTRAFFDANGDGSGDFRGLTEKLDYLQWLGVDCIWLLPFFQSPLRDGGYDISDFLTIQPDYGTVEDVRGFIEAAHQRGIRVIADLVMNHTSSDHAWFQESRKGGAKRDWYVWSDDPTRYSEARIIFTDTETSNWTWDDEARRLLLAPLLLPPARPELRQPRRPGRDARGPALLAGPGHGRLPPRRRALPVRARRHQRREPAGDARLPQARARGDRPPLSGPRPAGRGQPVAGRRRRVLRRRRRVPHGLPLPGHAAHVHGGPAGRSQPHLRDPRTDAGHPGQLPVGPVPQKPRRAHARDGHRRGTRLHVRGVRQGPADEDQRGHPAATRPADGGRPRRDRAAARDPVQPPGRAGPVLRRRDHDGRQRLPRRPRRRPHADAVERGPQRRLQPRGLRPALRARR